MRKATIYAVLGVVMFNGGIIFPWQSGQGVLGVVITISGLGFMVASFLRCVNKK